MGSAAATGAAPEDRGCPTGRDTGSCPGDRGPAPVPGAGRGRQRGGDLHFGPVTVRRSASGARGTQARRGASLRRPHRRRVAGFRGAAGLAPGGAVSYGADCAGSSRAPPGGRGRSSASTGHRKHAVVSAGPASHRRPVHSPGFPAPLSDDGGPEGVGARTRCSMGKVVGLPAPGAARIGRARLRRSGARRRFMAAVVNRS